MDAPLQRLQVCRPQAASLQAIARVSSPWVLFTSPASVEAMDLWIAHTGIHPMQTPKLRVAAVGSGTRQAIAEMVSKHHADMSRSWPISIDDIIVSASDEHADAIALLQALDERQRQEGFVWQDQSFFVAQGENNRPTLVDGLAARGADVMPLAMYRRMDVSWTDDIWRLIAASQPGEVGVVVTSSTVMPRLMGDLDAHGLNRSKLEWCTQHAAIAEKLRAQGVSRIRRVTLSATSLEKDLFESERCW